jgi:hypothetical protein
MKRFFNNEREDERSEDEDFEGEEIEAGDAWDSDTFNTMQLGLVEFQIKQQLFELAERICSREWFWRFRSSKAKMRRIVKVYIKMFAYLNG